MSSSPYPFTKTEARRIDSFGSESSTASDKEVKSARESWLKRRTATSSTSSSANESKPYRSPTVNLYTHCGRHTDQFLFGGHSLRDLFRRKH